MAKKPRYRYGNLNPGTKRFKLTGAFYFLAAWLAAGFAIPQYLFRPSEHNSIKECDDDYIAARRNFNERVFGKQPRMVYLNIGNKESTDPKDENID